MQKTITEVKKNGNGRKKNGKWKSYLEFQSIRTYLDGAIDSKKSTIGKSSNLEQKIANVSLTNYLRGIEVYLTEYCEFAKTPYELLKYYDEIRRSNNTEKLTHFKQNIENYIVWLKNEKGLSGATSQNYQAHLRGFLSWNNVVLKFRNYNERSDKAKHKSKFGIDSQIEMEMGKKIIGYVKDYKLKLFLSWMQISGLGSKELYSLKFDDLRYLDWESEMVRVDKNREKSGIFYTNFIDTITDAGIVYGELDISNSPNNLQITDQTGQVINVDHNDANTLIKGGVMHKISSVIKHE